MSQSGAQAGKPRSSVRKIPFNNLPRTVRERFIGCLNNKVSPSPILSSRSPYAMAITGWVILALIGGLIIFFRATNGYGSTYGDVVQSYEAMIWYGIGFFLVAFSILSIIKRLKLQQTLPYPPGRYLFATDVVDAQTDTLKIIPMNQLASTKLTHHYTNGVYNRTTLKLLFQEGSEEFTIIGRDLSEQIVNSLSNTLTRISRAAEMQDYNTVNSLDVFFEMRINDLWDKPVGQLGYDPGPRTQPLPDYIGKRALISLGAAFLLCAPFWFVRNYLSEEKLYQSAKQINSESAYKNYLSKGKRHAEEVKAALPNVALSEAKRTNTVSAFRHVVKDYPNTQAQSEARLAIHELYQKSLENFRKQAANNDPRLMPFLEKLITYLEKHDAPTVKVSFRSPNSSSLASTDKFLADRMEAAGKEFIPITKYFDDDHSRPREGNIVSSLQAAFKKIFPEDVFSLEKGEALKSDAPTQIDSPVMEIYYDVSWSGDTYLSKNNNRVFVGILVKFDLRLRIPQDPDGYNFKLDVVPPKEFTVSYEIRNGSPSAGEVYDVMASRAFDQFDTKLHNLIFKDKVTDTNPIDSND